MSQYINQVTVNIADIVRLQFNEMIKDDQPPLNSFIVCMHFEFLKVLYETIGRTIEQHEEQMKNKESNKSLS